MAKIKPLDIGLYILAVLLLSGAGYAWFVFSQQNRTLNAAIEKDKVAIAAAVAKVKLLEELKAKSLEFEAEGRRMASYIPSKEEQAQFVIELERLGDEAEVTVKSCTLDPEPIRKPELPGYLFCQWRLNLSGDYQGLLDFLDELPKGSRMIAVSELTVNSFPDDENQDYILDIGLVLHLVINAPPEKVKP